MFDSIIARGLVAAASALLAFLSVVGSVAAETSNLDDKSVDELAERLAKMRSEVDSLSTKVQRKKQRMRSRLRSIQRQRSDVELKLEQTRSEVQRLRRKVKKTKEDINKEKTAADELKPAVEEALETVRQSVRSGPPFKRDERLKNLDKLERQMNEGLLSPQKTVSRLWQFVEDELRLSQEHGMYRQVIELDGREVLADVARVGMVMLYFETEEGRMGVAHRTDEGWRWEPVEGEASQRRIETLFTSFNKGIRVGFFRLPNGLNGIDRYNEESQ